jgi:hypothetical protein
MHIHRHSTQSSSASIFMHCHCNLLLRSSSASIFMHCHCNLLLQSSSASFYIRSHCNLLSRSSSGSGSTTSTGDNTKQFFFARTASPIIHQHRIRQCKAALQNPRHIHVTFTGTFHVSNDKHAHNHLKHSLALLYPESKTCTQSMHSHTHTCKQQVTTSQSHNGFI